MSPEGVHMEVINYSGNSIVTIDVYEKHIKEEIKRVKSLIGDKNSPWIINDQPKDEWWLNDSVSKIPGASRKKRETLVIVGIKIIGYLKQLIETDLPLLKEEIPWISL